MSETVCGRQHGGLTWVVDTEGQRDPTLLALAEAIAGDGHCAVDGHLVLPAVLSDVERVWRKLRRRKEHMTHVASLPLLYEAEAQAKRGQHEPQLTLPARGVKLSTCAPGLAGITVSPSLK